MISVKKWISKSYRIIPCFYCGVDTIYLKVFLFGLFGFLIVGNIFFGVGMLLRGKFKNPEQHKSDVLQLENYQ